VTEPLPPFSSGRRSRVYTADAGRRPYRREAVYCVHASAAVLFKWWLLADPAVRRPSRSCYPSGGARLQPQSGAGQAGGETTAFFQWALTPDTGHVGSRRRVVPACRRAATHGGLYGLRSPAGIAGT